MSRCGNPKRVALYLGGLRPTTGWGQAVVDRDSGAPVVLAGHRWILRSAREEVGRDPGQGDCWKTLEGRNPWEVPAVARLKTPRGRKGLPEGCDPETESHRAGPALRRREYRLGPTVGGSIRVVTPWMPSGRRSLRRVNPRSAAGTKQDRHGSAGRKPSRG
jgi:hypothetical protein